MTSHSGAAFVGCLAASRGPARPTSRTHADRRRCPCRRRRDSREPRVRRLCARRRGEARRDRRASRVIPSVPARRRPHRQQRSAPSSPASPADPVRSLPRATSEPSADSTENVTRRWGGSLSRSNASMGTRMPERRRNSRCNPSSSGSAVRIDPCHHRACRVGSGNEVAAQVFRQRPDEFGDQFLAQRGHLPGELIAAKAREHVDRNVHRHAVVDRTRLESVCQGQFDTARSATCRAGRSRPCRRCEADRRG